MTLTTTNRAKFDACTSSSFRGVKTDTQTHRQTDRIALYILDAKVAHYEQTMEKRSAKKKNNLKNKAK